MIPSSAAQSIIITLAYFDLFDFPLTQQELWRYLWQSPGTVSWADFVVALEQLEREGKIERQWGFWFLPGRSEIVERRRRASVVVEQKLRRARCTARALMGVPFLKAIFISSSVAAETPGAESDLDFFIIAAPGRVWIARFWCNLILRLLGWRVYGAKRRDRVCLCFFVAADSLDLAPYRAAPDDIHFAYWLHQMLPLYDPENYYDKFTKANAWTKQFLPNLRVDSGGSRWVPRSAGLIAKIWKKFWESMWQGAYGKVIENQMKAIQLMKLKPSLKAKAKIGDNEVVIAEGVIKLHEHDTRKTARAAWQRRVETLGL